MRLRRHWMYFVRPGPVLLGTLSLILVWAATNPGVVLRMLHVTRDSPEFLLTILQAFYEHRLLCVAVPLGIAACMVLVSWGMWSISYFEVDDYGLTYKIGPFAQNTIPRRAIQDIRISRSVLGLLLGYGTLVVDSGREEETLCFVPDVDEFVALLRGRGFS